MELAADPEFGVETVTVAGVSKALDVCALADELYEAMTAASVQARADAPADGTRETILDIKLSGRAVAPIFVKWGFPEIEVAATAYHLASRVCVRAVQLGKVVGDVWLSTVGPASPNDSPESTSSD